MMKGTSEGLEKAPIIPLVMEKDFRMNDLQQIFHLPVEIEMEKLDFRTEN